MKFRKKALVVDATRWFKNGDHPQDGAGVFPPGGEFAGERLEGQVVRYFRHPQVSGGLPCRHCGKPMHDHGWIDTPEGGHIVCPGDWIVTGVSGEHYPVKPEIFAMTYELLDDQDPS